MRRAFRQGLLLAALLGTAAGFGLRSASNQAGAEPAATADVEVGAQGEAAEAVPHLVEGQFLKLDNFNPDKYTLVDDSKLVFGKDPNDPNLRNWADNNLATGLRKHHPKTYEEVAK
jgi:hypothetical protein